MFDQIKQLDLDGTGMLKGYAKVYYRYRERLYSVKGLYKRLRSENGRLRRLINTVVL